MATEKCTILKGRQVISMIYDHMKPNQNLIGVYSVNDLCNVAWLGVERVEEFMKIWRRFTSALKQNSGVNQETLRDLLLDKIPRAG